MDAEETLMLGWIKLVTGLGSGVSWVVYAVVFWLGIAVGAGPTIWIEELRVSSYERTAAAADKQLDNMTGQRNAAAAGLVQAQSISKSQQAQIDAGDTAANEAAKKQQDAKQRLEALNTSLRADNDHLFQQLEEALNARPTQISVSQVYPTGWDPLVASAAGYVRMQQLAFDPNLPDPAHGGVQIALPAGGPGAAGAAPGADLAAIAASGVPEGRPSAEQQANLIGYVSQLFEWGASCYRDKAAIAASQKTGDVTP